MDGSLASNLVIGLNFLFVNALLIVLINQILYGLEKTLKKDHYLRIKAQESDALKSAFLANISHEIRTPLNAILGFSGLVIDEYENNKEIKLYLNQIQNSGEQLLELIDNLISISIIQAGQVDVKFSEVSLSEIMNDCYFTASSLSKSELVSVSTSYDKDIKCKTDKVQLKQALANLIINALKFTESGEVIIGYKRQNHNILFFVKDSGPGIPNSARDDLFKRFYKIHNTEEIKAGAGLGLAITKGIVKSLQGRIWYDSEPGTGTTFYFTIPIEPVESQG